MLRTTTTSNGVAKNRSTRNPSVAVVQCESEGVDVRARHGGRSHSLSVIEHTVRTDDTSGQARTESGSAMTNKVGFGQVSLVLALVSAALPMACASAESPNGELVATASDSQGISWEKFRASAEIAPNGSLVVEGDMAFSTEESLRRYWLQHRAPGRGQKLAVNTQSGVDTLWPFPENLNITYCVGDGFTGPELGVLLPALDAAAKEWGRVAAIRFVRESVGASNCDSTDGSVAFDVQHRVGSSIAFSPFDGRPARTLYIGSFAFTTTLSGRTLNGIVAHEFGHVLGYRHEHIWSSGCSEDIEDPNGRIARLVTDYDELSVMHYPECEDPDGSDFTFSDRDHHGSVTLYGMHPALITSL